MQSLSIEALPSVIIRHFAACKDGNIDAYLETFAPDALVNDAQREFASPAAIRAWAEKEIFSANVTFEMAEAFEQLGNYVVRCRTDGDFDKSNLPDPLILTSYFSVQHQQVTQLIILLNRSAEA